MYVFRTVCLFMWRGAKISGQTRFPSTERPNSRSRIHIQHPNRQATRHKNTFKLWNVYRHDKLHLLSRGRRVRYICPSLRCHLNVKKLNFTTLFFGMYDLPISLWMYHYIIAKSLRRNQSNTTVDLCIQLKLCRLKWCEGFPGKLNMFLLYQ